MWQENQAGEFWWPLHPRRQQDHIRVWPAFGYPVSSDTGKRMAAREWYGALLIDGENVITVGPFADADRAKAVAYKAAGEYLLTLLYELSPFTKEK